MRRRIRDRRKQQKWRAIEKEEEIECEGERDTWLEREGKNKKGYRGVCRVADICILTTK